MSVGSEDEGEGYENGEGGIAAGVAWLTHLRPEETTASESPRLRRNDAHLEIASPDRRPHLVSPCPSTEYLQSSTCDHVSIEYSPLHQPSLVCLSLGPSRELSAFQPIRSADGVLHVLRVSIEYPPLYQPSLVRLASLIVIAFPESARHEVS